MKHPFSEISRLKSEVEKLKLYVDAAKHRRIQNEEVLTICLFVMAAASVIEVILRFSLL